MSGHQRRLVPGPSLSEDDQHESYHEHDLENDSPPAEEGKGSATWKKRVSTACLACKKSKRKVRFIYSYTTGISTSISIPKQTNKSSAPAHPLVQTAKPSKESASSMNPSTNAAASPQKEQQTNSPTTATSSQTSSSSSAKQTNQTLYTYSP